MSEGVQVVTRQVVQADKLQSLVNLMATLYGTSREIDCFEERLVFRPREEAGNMNYVNRDCVVGITYYGDQVGVTQIGSASSAGKTVKVPSGTEVYAVRRSVPAGPNVRRTLIKAGFQVKGDFAKKGLEFRTRNGFVIEIARPYNAVLNDTTYVTGKAAWDSLSGAHPFGQDYLLEIKKLVSTQEEVDAAMDAIHQLLERFGS